MEGISDSLRSQQKGSLISCPFISCPSKSGFMEAYIYMQRARCGQRLCGQGQRAVPRSGCTQTRVQIGYAWRQGCPVESQRCVLPTARWGEGCPGLRRWADSHSGHLDPRTHTVGSSSWGLLVILLRGKCCTTIKWDQIQLLRFKMGVMRIKSLCSWPYVGPCSLPERT